MFITPLSSLLHFASKVGWGVRGIVPTGLGSGIIIIVAGGMVHRLELT